MKEYEALLGYLEYGSTSDKLSLPLRIRERHLTPDATSATVQAVGPWLQISVWSERDNILVRVPLKEWQQTKPYEGSLSGPNKGILSVGRFEDNIDNEDDEIPATVAVHELDEP